MTNQLCVLEGDYKLQTHLKAFNKKNDSTNFNINDLIECYKSKFLNEQQQSVDEFVLVHSKDGGFEVYSNLMQHLNSTYDFDATLLNTLNHNNSTLNSTETKTTQQAPVRNNSSFVCFLISDFDQNDSNFTKLEETQTKICSFFNTISNNTLNATTNTTIIGNVSKRFMIFGWPVLNYCLENNMVNNF